MWNNRYEDLLVEWAHLREDAKALPIEDALHLVHDWWQQAPIVNGTIHINDPEAWPLPWDLLAQHAFCDLAKCLGLCYTLMLIEHEDIDNMTIIKNQYSTYLTINDSYALSDEANNIRCSIDSETPVHKVDCKFLKDKLLQ